MKNVLSGLALAALVVPFCVGQALAAPVEHFGQCHGSGRPIINVVQRIQNDIDSGVNGNYWAYDDLRRHIQVWQTGTNAYCAVVRDQGSFTTVAGDSPGGSTTIAAGITGTFKGGYTARITGTLKATPGASTRGFIGDFDYQCDASTGNCPGYVSWPDLYFNTGSTFDYISWGWIYHGGNNGRWVNAVTGNRGDIHN